MDQDAEKAGWDQGYVELSRGCSESPIIQAYLLKVPQPPAGSQAFKHDLVADTEPQLERACNPSKNLGDEGGAWPPKCLLFEHKNPNSVLRMHVKKIKYGHTCLQFQPWEKWNPGETWGSWTSRPSPSSVRDLRNRNLRLTSGSYHHTHSKGNLPPPCWTPLGSVGVVCYFCITWHLD